ncbi:uncharacterized protein ZHAS_00005191 [Anopheles sinensis]|uniref:Uncharacterized protein n=1 Tax=Anopheles sinensis TaxID=74873 RepID=A0A084VIT0_ANOSI|nr:uncharacterized protein ZHAS_00005191 [Anopheles sinensis]
MTYLLRHAPIELSMQQPWGEGVGGVGSSRLNDFISGKSSRNPDRWTSRLLREEIDWRKRNGGWETGAKNGEQEMRRVAGDECPAIFRVRAKAPKKTIKDLQTINPLDYCTVERVLWKMTGETE